MPDVEPIPYRADVLVVGGGPAACWAAITAAGLGARVILVDKGYCGTSGVAAAAGIGHWYLPPDPEVRRRAITVKDAQGGYLSDHDVMARVIEETWRRLPDIERWRYPFPRTEAGDPVIVTSSGPEYLRTLRRGVQRSGARILDHHPATELLVHDGRVAGAAGVHRRTGQPWRVLAGAVVLATGGCTWQSHSLGSDVDTGDGALMAAEVGAHLSGMEFSNFYGVAPAGCSMDKNGLYQFATFSRADGSVLAGHYFQNTWTMTREAAAGRLYAILDRVPDGALPATRAAQVNFRLTFEKLGIDPFRERFPIDFVLEGTVRGTGGLKVTDDDCHLGVPGLYAAGDVAARDHLVGATTGAGSPNASWALATGTWAARAAVRAARADPAPDDAVPVGGAGLRPTGATAPADTWRQVRDAVREQMLPLHRNAIRTGTGLRDSLSVLDGLWRAARTGLAGTGADVRRAREAAAMVAMARWAYRSALHRTESRGMHYRADHPYTDPGQRHRLLSGGLDEVWVRRDPRLPSAAVPAEAVAS